jgi:hypothetical protein
MPHVRHGTTHSALPSLSHAHPPMLRDAGHSGLSSGGQDDGFDFIFPFQWEGGLVAPHAECAA